LRDDHVIVLDFLSKGKSGDRRAEPIAQVIGEKYFSLLEVIVRHDSEIKQGDKLYIGQGERKEVDHIKKRIKVGELTNFARSELPFMIEKMVKDNQEQFVQIFNTAQPISTRQHQLELLPGIGKKHMWDIIKERKKSQFKDFKELHDRVKLLPDPIQMIVKRILEELEEDNIRFRLFVAGPPRRF
jgi:putative nucleotide binding protein